MSNINIILNGRLTSISNAEMTLFDKRQRKFIIDVENKKELSTKQYFWIRSLIEKLYDWRGRQENLKECSKDF